MDSRYAQSSPFDDPFFSDPFSSMRGMMSRMDQMMGHMFNDPFFSGAGFGPMQPMLENRRMPALTVEEVHDEQQGNGAQPVIQEPDEDYRHHLSLAPHQGPSHGDRGAMFPQSSSLFSGGTGPTYSYSSSMYMSNVNGVTYKESKTARAGPEGVKEMQRRVQDGRSGTETHTVARGLGDRARAITRRKDASGKETSEDILRGINQDEASRFDQEWEQKAQKNLLFPRGRASGQPQYLGSPTSGLQTPPTSSAPNRYLTASTSRADGAGANLDYQSGGLDSSGRSRRYNS